jgi:hypothetical protein
MTVPYKDHTITVSAEELPDEPAEVHWRPWAYVTPLHSNPVTQRINLKERFATREDAEQYALVFVREWIDQGKKPLDRQTGSA